LLAPDPRRLAMARMLAIPAFLITLAAASAGAIAVSRDDGANETAGTAAAPEPTALTGKRKPIRYEVADLFIETNATDRDAGLQLDLDAEDWGRLTIGDPNGQPLLNVKGKGRLREFGLTELFFEASEPSFDEFPFTKLKKRFPEGNYTFRGRTVDGGELVGSDRLSHLVPDGPVVTFPTEGAQVDPNGLTVTWEPVTTPAGVAIVRYIVNVTQENRELTMDLESTSTSASIPSQFLKPGTETGVEVLAREKSGNQTITAVSFVTM
jgi:hypothetical protein